ncbi:MAG: hypothetical protein ABJE10_20045 [bacterium]
MIQTRLWADPHGAYAIMALLVLAVLGAAIAPGGLRDRPRRMRRVVAAALLAGAALSLMWPQLVRKPALVVNPIVPSVAQLSGRWIDGADTLELRTDGAYACGGLKCTGFGAKGSWTREVDGSLIAHWSDGHSVPWRVVLYHDRYRLALAPSKDDGATWEGRLSFEKMGP